MGIRENIIKIWKAKGQILEGVTNSIFKREDVEDIAQQRMQICEKCALYTMQNEGCMVAGTGPCCNQLIGGCGCSLGFKTRSLSSDCPKGHWKAEVSQEEEDMINQKLGI
jgi:hypothetical protein